MNEIKESRWNDASVGRVVLMMKKKERGHWENILAVEMGMKIDGRRTRRRLATCIRGGR